MAQGLTTGETPRQTPSPGMIQAEPTASPVQRTPSALAPASPPTRAGLWVIGLGLLAAATAAVVTALRRKPQPPAPTGGGGGGSSTGGPTDRQAPVFEIVDEQPIEGGFSVMRSQVSIDDKYTRLAANPEMREAVNGILKSAMQDFLADQDYDIHRFLDPGRMRQRFEKMVLWFMNYEFIDNDALDIRLPIGEYHCPFLDGCSFELDRTSETKGSVDATISVAGFKGGTGRKVSIKIMSRYKNDRPVRVERDFTVRYSRYRHPWDAEDTIVVDIIKCGLGEHFSVIDVNRAKHFDKENTKGFGTDCRLYSYPSGTYEREFELSEGRKHVFDASFKNLFGAGQSEGVDAGKALPVDFTIKVGVELINTLKIKMVLVPGYRFAACPAGYPNKIDPKAVWSFVYTWDWEALVK